MRARLPPPHQRGRGKRRQYWFSLCTITTACFLWGLRPSPPSLSSVELTGVHRPSAAAYRELYDRTFPAASQQELSLETVIWPRNWKHLMTQCTLPDDYGTDTETVFSGRALRTILTPCQGGYIFLPSTSSSWFRHNNVDHFIRHVLPHFNQTFVLITADGDNGFPRAARNAHVLLDHPLLLRWYTQNYDGTIVHPKLYGIPIGLDLHTPRDGKRWDTPEAFDRMYQDRQAALLQQQQQTAPTQQQHLPLLPYWSILGRHADRRHIWMFLNICGVPHATQRTWNSDMAQPFASYPAGFSPHGNGLDCHRTFEMLWYGMIPIVKRSSLDAVLYHRGRVPVVRLEQWSDMCWGDPITPQIAALQQDASLWPPSDELFTMQYWLAP